MAVDLEMQLELPEHLQLVEEVVFAEVLAKAVLVAMPDQEDLAAITDRKGDMD